MSFEANIFVNQIQRIPFQKLQDFLKRYENDIKELSFEDQRAIMNFLDRRYAVLQRLQQADMEKELMFNVILFKQLGSSRYLPREARESAIRELRTLEVVPMIESLGYIDSKDVESVLSQYHSKISTDIIVTLLINLPENKQIKFIELCQNELMNVDFRTFSSFMASVSKEAQKYIIANFSDKFNGYSEEEATEAISYLYKDNVELYTSTYSNMLDNSENLIRTLVTCDENEFERIAEQNKEKLREVDAEELMKIFCYKTYNSEFLYNFWNSMLDKLSEVSTSTFKTFIRRLDEEQRHNAISSFSDKFSQMGLNEIIELFENDTNEIKAEVLVEYYSKYSSDSKDSIEKFMSKDVKARMIELYIKKQEDEFKTKQKNGIDLPNEFNDMVSKLNTDKAEQLFDYDYIQAITLARFLLDNKSIDDKNIKYIELRNKYMKHLLNNLQRDNTMDESMMDSISRSMFYRITKGKISFEQLDKLKTFKAFIYLARNPQAKDISMTEGILDELNEKQVQSFNLKLYKRLCDTIRESYKTSKPLDENIHKMALKLFIGFGFNNALKIIEQRKRFTSLEYLLNGMKINNTEIDNEGNPILNSKLMNFLFGHNSDDKNANMLKIMNGQLPFMENRFSQIYNNWDNIYEKLNGNVSVKRIMDLLKDPTTYLNPDEYRLEVPLKDIDSQEPAIIEKAREWYKVMKGRKYSSIPKVTGNLDEYTYEILDLDDPSALAVGYLTRCCFLINGLSRESLYHSISSKNGRTFVVKKNGELIAQSWVWRNGNVLCFDNVETRGNYSYDTLLSVYQKASQELLEKSNTSEDPKESLKVITYGTSESKMSRPSKIFAGILPRVLESVGYSDAKYEQCILAEKEYDTLYYGEVTAKYLDPRPLVREFTNISAMNDVDISTLNTELDSIEYSSTGKVRKNNARNCRYIAINKDWYIAITDKGHVEIQLLKDDERATEECKQKAKEIMAHIKKDEIIITPEFASVGGEDR